MNIANLLAGVEPVVWIYLFIPVLGFGTWLFLSFFNKD